MQLFSFLCLLGLVACTPTIDHRGFNVEHASFDQIVVNVDTATTVQEKLGSPSSVGVYPDEKGLKSWYYITKKTATTSFYHPDTVEQQTVILKIDAQDIVRHIEKKQGEQTVEFKKETTQGHAEPPSMMKDVFGSFGVLNRKKQPSSQK